MHMHKTQRLAAILVLVAAAPWTVRANLIDEEKQLYFVRPLATEPAWTSTGFFFHSMLFDLPNAPSRPSAQVGFVFTPGLRWSVFDWIELQIAFPMVINPDATGDRELDQAGDELPNDPLAIRNAPQWDASPDFDLPGLVVGLKSTLFGKKGEDPFLVAVGLTSSIPLGSYDRFSTNFMPPKTMPGHANSLRLAPYLSLAYALGRFSPQLQMGASFRFDEKYYDPEKPPFAGGRLSKGNYIDFFVNLALPFALLYERTAPVLEINGVFGEQQTQLFITPAVTFLPKHSPALLSFACMIPVFDADFREREGFRFMLNFSYRLDVLGISAEVDEPTTEKTIDMPPAEW